MDQHERLSFSLRIERSPGGFGRVFVTGWTNSTDFPVTPGAFQTSVGSAAGMYTFVPCLDSTLSSLLHSIYFVGTGFEREQGNVIAASSSGVVTITGYSSNAGFPTTPGAFSTSQFGYTNAFISRFDPTSSELLYSSWFGGQTPLYNEAGEAVAHGAEGSAVLTGVTNEPDLPTSPGAVQTSFAGSLDCFVAEFDMLPTGTCRFGTAAAACLGPIWIGPTRMPVQGDSGFGFYASGAAPSTLGVLAVGAGQATAGLPLFALQVYLDPAAPIFMLGALSDAFGYAERAFPLAAGTAGATAYFQFACLNSAACGGLGTLSSSHALAVTVQP